MVFKGARNGARFSGVDVVLHARAISVFSAGLTRAKRFRRVRPDAMNRGLAASPN
jgi:hypothetical protein